MIKDIIKDAQKVPSRIASRRREATRWVRQQVHTAREQGQQGLWKLALRTGLELRPGFSSTHGGLRVTAWVGASSTASE